MVGTVSGTLVERDGDVGSGEPELVEADPEAGFNYPYFLYVPDATDEGEALPILVNPNNSPRADDDFEVHLDRAERSVYGGTGRHAADELGVPLLVPVFPRPRTEPVDSTHLTIQLDDTTMKLDDGPLERIDLQLLRMVDDARGRLRDRGYQLRDRIMLNGFSAPGNFSDRFTVLHPEEVLSVTAGGVNGMTVLPKTEDSGHTLDYHVGVANVEELTGEPPNVDALTDVNQFFYMGGEDENDTIGGNGTWTDDELEQVALDVYGEDMLEDRFPKSQAVYEEVGTEAQFRVYEDFGHTPAPARADIVEFHRRSMNGEDVSEFDEDVGVLLTIDGPAEPPAAGEAVTFAVGDLDDGLGSVEGYTWTVDGETVGTGDSVTHTFDEPGEYVVTLAVESDAEGTVETSLTVSVGPASGVRTVDVEASIDFVEGPVQGDTTLLVDATVDEEYDPAEYMAVWVFDGVSADPDDRIGGPRSIGGYSVRDAEVPLDADHPAVPLSDGQTITVAILDDPDSPALTARVVTVGEVTVDDPTETPTDDAGTEAPADGGSEPTEESAPGFGVIGSLAGVGGAGYALARSLRRDGVGGEDGER